MRRNFLLDLVFSVGFTTLAASSLTVGKNPARFLQDEARSQELRSDESDANLVYDREYSDYHKWDDNEDRAYRLYWQEQHRAYRDYSKLNRRQQCRYWKWRHSHPDRGSMSNMTHY